MRCDICGCQETYIKNYSHNYTIKGKNIIFTSKRKFCKNCNNLVYDSILDNNASELAIEIYNTKYGISKDEIINLRKKLGLSQELFSKVIGCAKKTLISYEKGKSIPNDSYLILIKSLIAKPDTIITIIDANKNQFTSKEYNKINEKVNKIFSNNINQLVNEGEILPDEFNGYSIISKDKIFNIISFFSSDGILKTKLLKEMFYADFIYYRDTCKSITGLEYAKLPLGPVPDQFELLLNECSKEQIIDYKINFNGEYECHKISSIKKCDISIFDDKELEILKYVKETFKDYSSKDISEFSHKEKAYINTQIGKKISYDYAFEINSI